MKARPLIRRKTSTQRQDSLHDQMLDLIRIAEREGMYDAADWIKARWNMPRYWDMTPDALSHGRKIR